MWGRPQQESFEKLKTMLTTSPVLALFDPGLETTVSADASSFGLEAVLLQKQKSGELKPVVYVSRSMTPTEQRYAQIEKEALAFTFACERLATYLVGLKFSTKRLDELPVRVQRFRLHMLNYDFTISHVPGKYLVTADTLSRAPSGKPQNEDVEFEQDTTAFINQLMETLSPAAAGRDQSLSEE